MTSSLATAHCEYEEQRCAWKRIRDAYKGQEHIHKLGVDYLPPTTGMARLVSGNEGTAYQWDAKGLTKYAGYKMRALFPGDMAEMVRTAIGILWNKDATIEVPKKLEYIKQEATSEGDSIFQLMRDINVEQLLVGRAGLFADLPVKVRRQAARPYFTLYKAEKILNWDIGARGIVPYRQLNLVVLDESENERQDDLSYSWVEKYLILSIGSLAPNDVNGDYYWGRFRGVPQIAGAVGPAHSPLFDSSQMAKAGIDLPFIPFTFINSTNINPRVEAPPHMDLADLCVSLYQNSADLEQMIHEHAQETLVVEGGEPDKDYCVGVGATLVPGTGNKAYFIGLNGKGLPEAQKHYQNKRIQIERRSGQMIDTRSLQRESGESLKTRLAAQTATLSMIAKACGWGIERGLRQMAVMVGADPTEVRVKPNVNFLNPELFAKTLVELMQAKNMGGPFLAEDIHNLAQERGVTDKDWVTVQRLLKLEPTPYVTPGQITGNPGGQPDPKVIEGESAKIAAKAKASNPTGTSSRGTVRNSKKKATSK